MGADLFRRRRPFRKRKAQEACLTALTVLCLVPLVPARAQVTAQTTVAPYVTRKDIQVAVRAFSFVYGLPTGDIQMEIVYDPARAPSLEEARQLQKIIGNGSLFANRKVTAKMVAVSQIGETNSRFAYITHGLEENYPALAKEARRRKMMTFSTDFKCVDSQSCVMGVASSPSINIEISHAATEAADIQFSQALELMVRVVE